MFAEEYLRSVAVEFFSSLRHFPRKERGENEGAFPYFQLSFASFYVLSKRNVTAAAGGREDVSFCRRGGEKRGLRCQLLRGKGKGGEESGDVWGRKSIP